jgi:hypothetical protein
MMEQRHLDWSDKQKRILTADHRADDLYTAERGFPFEETELPHHHVMKGDTHAVFSQWKKGHSNNNNNNNNNNNKCPLAGAWTRLVFMGGWEHTSLHDERTFNLQTDRLFIDLRIPRTREALLRGKTSLQDLTPQELKYYARQHVFAGYTRMRMMTAMDHHQHQHPEDTSTLVCTRHHCIDWNFVGAPRTRPNKWYAEFPTRPSSSSSTSSSSSPPLTWKEWAFATDERGQHYYLEQWERLPGGDATPMVAWRRRKQQQQQQGDGILLIVGDHFSYILGRDHHHHHQQQQQQQQLLCPEHSSLVAMVDAAVDRNDLATARAYLSRIQAGHGRIANGKWIIDCAIEPWREGTSLWETNNNNNNNNHNNVLVVVTGNDLVTSDSCCLQWNDQIWELFDTSLTTLAELQDLMTITCSNNTTTTNTNNNNNNNKQQTVTLPPAKM